MDDEALVEPDRTARLPRTSRQLDELRTADPDAIDGYQLSGRIPGNHASDVFVADHQRFGRCVLKLSGAVGAERTARESRYLAQVRSHRVARVVDSGTWQDRAYFVQEFIDGPTLADVLREGGGAPMAPTDSYRLAQGLAEAVRDVHRAGLLHRDVKPANIIVHTTRGVILVDFGIALSEVDPRLTQGLALGTPRYMSPEQLHGDEVEATDIFQWGLVVGEAVLGRHPLLGIDDDRREAISRCRPDPALAGSLGRLVGDALQRTPEVRPTIHQILSELERTEVSPGPNETLAIPLPQRRLTDARHLDDLVLLATPYAEGALRRLGSSRALFAGAAAAAVLVGWLIGFLVGAILGAPWSGS